MTEQIINENETFELNGVTCQILSVGAHTVDGEPAGYSYSFRPVADIEQDARVAEEAERKREEAEAAAAEERAKESASEEQAAPSEPTTTETGDGTITDEGENA